MKKWIAFLMTILCIGSVSAFAAEPGADLTDSEDYAEIGAMKADIAAWVNHMLESDTDEQPIAKEDVDFSRAYRIDIDSAVFTQKDNSLSATDAYLDKQDCYIWEIPVDAGEHTVVISMSIGNPPDEQARDVLTEEEYQQALKDVGHWGILSSELLEKGQDIPSRAQAVLSETKRTEPVEIRYLGGESAIHTVMAIVYENGTPTTVLPMVGDFSIQDNRTKTPVETVYEVNHSYDFETVRDMVRLAEPLDGDSGAKLVIQGEQERSVPTALVVGIAVIAVLIVFAAMRRRKKA